MDYIDVHRVPHFAEIQIGSVRAIEISTHLQVRSGVETSPPAARQVLSRKIAVRLHVRQRWRRILADAELGPRGGAVSVAEKRQLIPRRGAPIHAKPCLRPAPVVEVPPVAMELGTARKSPPV